MLALKDWSRTRERHFAKGLLDLPDELLDLVMLHVYLENPSLVRDLLPPSQTCHRLRKATAPILFHTLSLRITQRYVDRRTFNILLNLDLAPYTFASHVRHLKQDDSYCYREDGCEDLRLSNELVREVALQGIRTLCNVRAISVGCYHSPLIHLMRQAFPDKSFRIRIEGCVCPRAEPTASPSPSSSILGLCQTSPSHCFEVALQASSRPCALEQLLKEKPENVRALSWTNTTTLPWPWPAPAPAFASFDSLEEIHLSGILAPALDSVALDLPQLRSLKRLSLRGADFCSAGLKIVSQLENLESLRLNSSIDRIFHAHLRNHAFEGLPYLRLPKLRSLGIRYISRYLSIEHIIPPNIRHLRIEYHNRTEKLTPFALRWIARNAPHLECLELNAGTLANLWHPTAVAGVDVDVEVYGVLEALSRFKNLHTLRLFPSYWQSALGYLHFAQPVTDEQAVRIFHHVQPRCAKLRLLIISNSSFDYQSRHEAFSRGIGGEPVKWMVRPWGSKTLLVTHEAQKHYHLEQIWEGERRLRMTTRRHYGRRLHFDELQEWSLPMYELPFDQPRPCVRGQE